MSCAQPKTVTITAIHNYRAGDMLNFNARLFRVTRVFSHWSFEAAEVTGWRLKWLRVRSYILGLRHHLTNLRWNLTIRWRLSGGEWYPFRSAPDDVVQRWAVIRPNMREDQVDVVLKARDELSMRENRWMVCDAIQNPTGAVLDAEEKK